MALSIVESVSKFAQDKSHATVVVESDLGPPFSRAFAELDGFDAVSLAQDFAARNGCAPAYVNGNKDGPYPVNSDGVPLDEVHRDENGNPLSDLHPKMQPVRYRLTIPIARPFR